jgi:hypothetical protein
MSYFQYVFVRVAAEKVVECRAFSRGLPGARKRGQRTVLAILCFSG